MRSSTQSISKINSDSVESAGLQASSTVGLQPVQKTAEADHVVIRGRRLDLDRHVDPKLFDPSYIAEMRRQLQEATPFPHLAVSGWFNPVLLELVREEFDFLDKTHWKVHHNDNELTRRSAKHDDLGPASQIYFGIVNSGWFVDLISEITGEKDLLPDPTLLNGGLHETPPDGKFSIHRDFDRHARYGLNNKMVFITYLNRNWDPAWGAALELWDSTSRTRVRSVQPELGHSVLLVHGPKSFHGHPEPMTAPAGQTRRSVAVYYYDNPAAEEMRAKRVSSVFLFARRSPSLRRTVRQFLPPILVDALKKLMGR
jgi:Rps23 Pro-64 3,4-dihydroxylase Tpa1-like proline 4-hydroxylase